MPSRAASVRSRAYFFSASYPCSALAVSAVRPLRISLIAAFSACAFTPPAFSASFAPDFTTASAVRMRSTVTKLSPAFELSFSASASTLAVPVSITSSPPSTRGTLASAASSALRTCPGSPPARAIRFDASPCSSSISAFNRCSGSTRWWFSRSAIVCAACTNPRARSVNFSKFIPLSQRPRSLPIGQRLARLNTTAARHGTAGRG